MAITIEERVNSRSFEETTDGLRFTRVFVIQGTDEPLEAAPLGPQIGDRFADNLIAVKATHTIVRETGDEADGVIEKTVEYETTTLLREDDFTFSTISQTAHIESVRKLSDQKHYPEDKDVGQFIGVNSDGTINGVDIFVPQPSYEEVHERSNMDAAYRNVLVDLSGKINDAPFKGFKKGEVLFLGATANRRIGQPWRINYQFLISLDANFEVDVVKDDGTTETVNVSKKGWEYYWVRHVEVEAEVDKRDLFHHRIESAHLATVYEEGDFGQLGIGTALVP